MVGTNLYNSYICWLFWHTNECINTFTGLIGSLALPALLIHILIFTQLAFAIYLSIFVDAKIPLSNPLSVRQSDLTVSPLNVTIMYWHEYLPKSIYYYIYVSIYLYLYLYFFIFIIYLTHLCLLKKRLNFR